MKRIIFALAAILCAASLQGRRYTLFDGGESSYTIIVADGASESEKFAAEELQHWIKETGGVTLPLGDPGAGKKGKRIIVGYNPVSASLLRGEAEPDEDDESFLYCNVGGDIVIVGGAQRGTMYGVFSFLENELGVRWYTSKVSKVHRLHAWSFNYLHDRESPGIKVRNDYYRDAFDPLWSVRNKNNGGLTVSRWKRPNLIGGGYGFWGCHTLGRFVPAHAYFGEHPEYFSEVDGKRLGEHTQLCLSNPDVFGIVVEAVRKAVNDHPGYLIYDISQNDCLNPCQCESCRKIKDLYGGTESGIMLWFVNKVAETLKDEFPDKYFGTFAYQYTRTPPKNIRPADNVVVRLCSIECCFIHDLASCPQNAEFVSDLRFWSEIAPRLYVWDYVTQFNQYPAPFPNFYSLQPNIRTFRDNNVIGIMEQGDYQTGGSCFGALKQYVIAKLLWDPDCDVQEVIDDFIYGYYGKSAPQVRQFFDLCQSLVRDDVHQGCFSDCFCPVYTDAFLDEGMKLYERASASAISDIEISNRVDLTFLPVFYLIGARDPVRGREVSSLIRTITEREGIRSFAEWGGYVSVDEYLKRIQDSKD